MSRIFKEKDKIEVRVHPETAKVLLRRAGLQKKEIRGLSFRFENDSASIGRKLESGTIKAMLKQHNFSDEEIKQFFSEKNFN